MVKGGKKYKKTLDSYEDVVEEFNQIEESESESEHVEEFKTAIDKTKVKKLIKSSSDSVGGLRKLLKLYRAGCHISEDNQTNFDSPATLTIALTKSLKKLPRVFKKAFRDKSIKPSVLTSYKNLFRSYLANTLYLLKQVQHETLLADIFSSLSKILKHFKFFPELIKGFVKNSIKVWSESGKVGKLVSYQFIREVLAKNFYDKVSTQKLLFVNFTKNSKFMNWSNYLDIETMRKCFVDLLGVDLSSSYQVVFASLRQLSMFLSQTVKNPSSDRIKTIYNWQFLNSFILVGQSIMAYNDLLPLVHPLVQIATGILSLTNISKYFPLKLHLLRVLINVQSHCKLYIPSISPNICEILSSASLSKSTSNKKLKEFSFIVAIKASKDQLGNELYREQLVDEATECLIEHFAAISQLVALPEIFLPVKMTLKKFCKSLRNTVFRQKISHALKIVQDSADWMMEKRKNFKSLEQERVSEAAPILGFSEKILKRRQEIVNSKLNIY